jgi:TonB-linked SusC/RagA family outer membrane protein
MKQLIACLLVNKSLSGQGRKNSCYLWAVVIMTVGIPVFTLANPAAGPTEKFSPFQSNTVTGTVRSSDGQPLSGASITVQGTNQGVTSDEEGNFSIAVPSRQSTLLVEYTGYLPQEIRLRNQNRFDISLARQNSSMDSVVVIGYGTARKSDLTGAVGTVKATQLAERPASSLAQGLAGRMAGVNVNWNSGRPGGRTVVRIRGFSSINTSNNPLYVIDGVAMPVGLQVQATNAIDYINPDDIVSVEVLKDASATAIYGARGASGVILVTTRRGRTNTPGRITYTTNLSTTTIGPNRIKMLNAREFLAVEDLAFKNMEKYDPAGWASGKYASRNPAMARTDPRIFNEKGEPIYETDWLEESTQSKLSQNHNIGIAGGGATSSYYIGLGYRDDKGLLLNSYLRRYSARLAFDDEINGWLKIGATLSYNTQEENIVDQDYQVMRNIAEGLPFQPVKYEDGTWTRSQDYPNVEAFWNPVHLLTERKFIVGSQTTIATAFSTVTFAEGLEMRTVLGANILNQDVRQSTSRTLAPGPQGTASVVNGQEKFWSIENYLTYTKQLNDDHAIKALLGISWQEQNFFVSNVGIQNFSSDYFLFNNLGAGSLNPSFGSNASRFAFNSYFTRLNYGFRDKYLLTLTGRVDGSSRFGENHKYAFFPSAGLAWKVSDEPFFQDMRSISHLKLRTSYGLTGNSEIPSYSSLGVLSSNYAAVLNEARVGGTGIGRLANPDLRWEKTAQFDIGLELGLFQNRISFEADYYYRKTTDMLLDAPVPRSSGYATIRKNVGSMENKGFEFTLNTANIVRSHFSWTTNFNISFNKNKVLSLATPADIFGIGGPGFTNQTNIIRVGEPVGSFWGLVRLGTWSEAERAEAAKYTSYRNGLTLLPGDIKYLDVNGDYIINDADRMIIGNGYPTAYGGFTNSLKLRNWELILELQYSFGNDVLDQTLHSSEDRQALANSYRTVLNAWTPENQNTPIAEIRDTRAGYVTNVDSRWIADGSFIRGRNLLLAYNLPIRKIGSLALTSFRINASAQNFFLITDYEHGDPEVTLNTFGNESNRVFAQGQNFHAYPKPTIYMLGLQIGF